MKPAPLNDMEFEDLYFTELDNRVLSFGVAVEAEVNVRWQKMLGDSEPVAWRCTNWSGDGNDYAYRDADDCAVNMKGEKCGEALFTRPASDHTVLLRQALEALENSIDAVRNEYETDWRHGYPTREAQLAGMKEMLDQHEAAITAIKEALLWGPEE